MMKPSKERENEVPDNEKQREHNLYNFGQLHNFGRYLIEEALVDFDLFYTTLRLLHKAMGKTFNTDPKSKWDYVFVHKIFKEVNSRGGIQKVIKENRWQQVCEALGITDHARLHKVYYSFLLDQYELLSLINDQTPKSPPSDPHLRMVKQDLSTSEALFPLNSVPKAGDNTTKISTSLSSGYKSSLVTPYPAKMHRPGATLQQNPGWTTMHGPEATLQQNPEFHLSNTKSPTGALPPKEVGPGTTSTEIPESRFSDRVSLSPIWGVIWRPPTQTQEATLQQIPAFHSSDKRGSSIRTRPDKDAKPGATSDEIPEFQFSNKRSTSIGDVRSKAPQKGIQDPSLLQSIPQSNDLFFREHQMGTDRAAKRQKELVGTNLDGKDEVGTNSYPGIGPEGNASGGNFDLKGKHVGTHNWGGDSSLATDPKDWGNELSLAAGLSSSRPLSKAKRVEDKDLDVNK